ncbi:MAG TPA: cytochrome c biogenesis protein CcsA [Candidatus Limnocylindria bacterium]|nr:cytochrome c biogenesis protein CcsA [Candidatus Limnocylindria bacterium]
MASGSLILYTAGTILLALGFAAHIAHAVLLANGRRSIAILAPRPQPAYAGVVTGSFVEGRGRSERLGDRPTSAAAPFAWGLTLAAWLAIGLSMLMRAVIVGRGPWGNMFEFTVAFAFTIAGGYLFLERRYPIRSIGFLPIGVALMLLAYSATLPKQIEPLVPALQNAPLLTIHVGMATIAYGIFATSFAAGVGYLVQGVGDRFAWLPSHKVLDEVAYRAVIIGFPIFATMIILGSWWASIAWSRYWGWDPKETSALVTWLTYAIYLHARNRRSWAGRPAALLLVVGFGMVLVTYSGSLWFNGLHAYSGLN